MLLFVVLVVALGVSTSNAQTTTVSPLSPARERLDWLVGQMNSNDADEASISAGFTPSFLAAVPFAEVASVLTEIVGERAGWRIAKDSQLGPLSGTAVVESSDGTKVEVKLSVEPGGRHRIVGLLMHLLPADKPITPAVFDATLRKLGPAVAFGLCDISKGNCALVHGLNDQQVMPIASTFKLWILAALGTEIQAGRASWDETIPITSALISTPNGEIARTKPGTKVSLRRLAELMISVSDNSAADHLLNRIGRKTVERAMRGWCDRTGAKHSDAQHP